MSSRPRSTGLSSGLSSGPGGGEPDTPLSPVSASSPLSPGSAKRRSGGTPGAGGVVGRPGLIRGALGRSTGPALGPSPSSSAAGGVSCGETPTRRKSTERLGAITAATAAMVLAGGEIAEAAASSAAAAVSGETTVPSSDATLARLRDCVEDSEHALQFYKEIRQFKMAQAGAVEHAKAMISVALGLLPNDDSTADRMRSLEEAFNQIALQTRTGFLLEFDQTVLFPLGETVAHMSEVRARARRLEDQIAEVRTINAKVMKGGSEKLRARLREASSALEDQRRDAELTADRVSSVCNEIVEQYTYKAAQVFAKHVQDTAMIMADCDALGDTGPGLKRHSSRLSRRSGGSTDPDSGSSMLQYADDVTDGDRSPRSSARLTATIAPADEHAGHVRNASNATGSRTPSSMLIPVDDILSPGVGDGPESPLDEVLRRQRMSFEVWDLDDSPYHPDVEHEYEVVLHDISAKLGARIMKHVSMNVSLATTLEWVLVENTRPNGVAQRCGVGDGDAITHVNGESVCSSSFQQVQAALSSKERPLCVRFAKLRDVIVLTRPPEHWWVSDEDVVLNEPSNDVVAAYEHAQRRGSKANGGGGASSRSSRRTSVPSPPPPPPAPADIAPPPTDEIVPPSPPPPAPSASDPAPPMTIDGAHVPPPPTPPQS